MTELTAATETAAAAPLLLHGAPGLATAFAFCASPLG